MTKPQSVDEYIASFPDPVQQRLGELRELARAQAPDATEGLKWGEPAYSLETILFIVAAYTNHANVVFTPSTREAFDGELADFRTGKGSVQVPHDGPVPADLLGRMMAYRVREWQQDGVRWM